MAVKVSHSGRTSIAAWFYGGGIRAHANETASHVVPEPDVFNDVSFWR